MKLNLIKQAMRAAATRGYDPLNSHPVQAEMLQRHWRMESGRRSRSEANANREMRVSALLRRQAGDAEHHEQWYDWPACSGDGEFSPE